MFTYFTTPFQCNYSPHNARTFCTFFFLFFAILRCATLPTRPWTFQGSDFPPKLSCHCPFDFFHIIYLLLQEANKIFIFFFSPGWIHVKRLPPGVAAPLARERSAVAWDAGTTKGFSDFQDFQPCRWTTRPILQSFPAFEYSGALSALFPLCLYQPIPTEF